MPAMTTATRAAAPLLPTDPAGQRVLAKFFRTLGEPSRLRLLEYLLDGERSVTDCVDALGLTQSRVSAHLSCLADCGYVTARRHGRFAYYQVSDPRVPQLVMLARALAADNAAALAACTRIDA